MTIPVDTTIAAIVTRPIHEGWTVRATRGPIPASLLAASIPATVPGLVHVDLLSNSLIPDPYLDQNEKKVTWIGETDWEYTTSFEWQPDGHEFQELVFEGLDTVATVLLNGREIARTRNQHRTYRIGVSDFLTEGSNELTVRFASPVAEADRASLELGYRAHTYSHPFNAIRKAACNFGWDWGLDAASVGIWKPLTLQSWTAARLSSVRPVVTVDSGTGTVSVQVQLERSTSFTELQISATIAGAEVTATVNAGTTSVSLDVTVDDVELWWPRGYGEQPLYDLDVRLSVAGEMIDSWSSRVGFRTIALEMEPDDGGTSFRFVVNGSPVWIRGANWIPDDAFITRVTRERLSERLDQAEFANMNLMRIWGGGYFESDDFYDLCDERGILVWQDFLFACAAYAEEEPLWSEVEAEVRDNVTRIMPHASLALWNGNNENIWGYEEWGWAKRLQGRTWGLGYYLDLLPSIVNELDPGRPYTPGSPWSGSTEIFANNADHGSVHLWELWNRVDYPAYRDIHARFVAEFGWQGPATWSTITQSISDNPLTPESPGMIHHQKATDGNDKLTDGLVAHLPLPDDTEDWHWAMSLNQALAVTVAIEHMRSESPRCMGSVVWQLNDCWPVTSWAAVDGYGRAKPLLYALKHVYEDTLLTVQPRGDDFAAVMVNDSPRAWEEESTARRVRFDGTVLAEYSWGASIAERSTQSVTLPPEVVSPSDPTSEYIVVLSGDRRAFWFFTEYRDSTLPAAQLSVDASRVSGGYRVVVTVATLTRDIALLVDKLDPSAKVDDMLVTLQAGEQVTFTVTTEAEIDLGRFSHPDVLRTANQLVADWSN